MTRSRRENQQAHEQAQTQNQPPAKRRGLARLVQSENQLERAMGLEPTTSSLGSWHSTN